MFIRYALIGLINTATHFFTFFALISLGFSQAVSNISGFMIAVSVSYILNSKFTFKVTYRLKRYVSYVVGMGCLSYLIGWLGDFFALNPWVALISFSLLSLFLGFQFSKFILRRE
ncbi:GtrA family protein [Algicola sagamiensis]|uniref:GtrA family protein n=1 Tax=Algicola sagamiensis TaxID=163869 RepID=UPI000368A874